MSLVDEMHKEEYAEREAGGQDGNLEKSQRLKGRRWDKIQERPLDGAT